MTENEKKILDWVLSGNDMRGRQSEDLIQAVLRERISEAAKEAYLLAAVRYYRERNLFWAAVKDLNMPEQVSSELHYQAEALAKAEPGENDVVGR